jgi:hypothetical protein
VPDSRVGVWATVRGLQVLCALPTPMIKALAKVNSKNLRVHDSMVVKDYTGSVVP